MRGRSMEESRERELETVLSTGQLAVDAIDKERQSTRAKKGKAAVSSSSYTYSSTDSDTRCLQLLRCCHAV
eukprot:9482182-Pyramimonas_sp.AAC.1